MPSKLIGKVTKHVVDGDFHKFTINGKELKSKFEETYEGLERGMTVEAEYTESKSGKFINLFLGTWKEIEDDGTGDANINDVPEPAQPDNKVDPEVWAAKDRAIHMESAYKTAAAFLTGRDGDAKELSRVAQGIYIDIQRAHDGHKFVKAE